MKKQKKDIQKDGQEKPETGVFQKKNGQIQDRKQKRKKRQKSREIKRKENRVW